MAVVGIMLGMCGSLNADERGIASTFSDRRVACPPYRIDPFKVMGAAHKTLPCGTMVEVTNLANGRKAVVEIVDIGPCTSDGCRRGPLRVRRRIFDLLPAAARAVRSGGLIPVALRVM